MTSLRPRALLLACLLALHLLLQPLAMGSMCAQGAPADGGSCCCVEPADAEPAVEAGCCGSDEELGQGEREPGLPVVERGGCDCQVLPAPPVSTPTEHTDVQRVATAASLWIAPRFVHALPGPELRPLHACKDASPGRRRSAQVLNQVFRL